MIRKNNYAELVDQSLKVILISVVHSERVFYIEVVPGITARHLPHILYQPTGSSKLHLLSPVHIQSPSPLPHN